ncbi:MAG: hypothetical protein JWM91_1894 [Rhodospirillales bacterium]|nr:hypothetical protein [Rhodospirillales bacterium]
MAVGRKYSDYPVYGGTAASTARLSESETMTTILEKTTGLVAFVPTIESGSFSAASRLVGSSQSAISKSVAPSSAGSA